MHLLTHCLTTAHTPVVWDTGGVKSWIALTSCQFSAENTAAFPVRLNVAKHSGATLAATSGLQARAFHGRAAHTADGGATTTTIRESNEESTVLYASRRIPHVPCLRPSGSYSSSSAGSSPVK